MAKTYKDFSFQFSKKLPNPLLGGAEGVAFGVGPAGSDNPPLHPSRGGTNFHRPVVPQRGMDNS
jgi:hypothetical protein